MFHERHPRTRGHNKSSPKSNAKGERNENLCDPPQPGWQTERSKSVGHLMFGIPGVDAGNVDMLPTKRRDVIEQSIRNISTRSLQLCDCTVEIDRIPVDDRTYDEVETRGAKRLALERPVAILASFVEEHSAFQLMGGLARVETGLASPPLRPFTYYRGVDRFFEMKIEMPVSRQTSGYLVGSYSTVPGCEMDGRADCDAIGAQTIKTRSSPFQHAPPLQNKHMLEGPHQT
jgi:hypothetical protein